MPRRGPGKLMTPADGPAIGTRFGRWKVTGESRVEVKRARAGIVEYRLRTPCVCNCGTERDVLWENLEKGVSMSCGCRWREHTHSVTHGASKTPLYNVWSNMWQRCENPKASNYSRYGGRGIRVSPAWRDFVTFREWAVANAYRETTGPLSERLTIDRIDPDGNYEPENCQWITFAENMRRVRRAKGSRVPQEQR